jgi:hypothetical protein
MKSGRKLLAASAGLAAVSYLACDPKPVVTGNLMSAPDPAALTVEAGAPEPVPTRSVPLVSGNLMAPQPQMPPDASVIDAGSRAQSASADAGSKADAGAKLRDRLETSGNLMAPPPAPSPPQKAK